MKLCLALLLAFPAAAGAQSDCAPADDQKLCAAAGEILPAALELWDKPYGIPKDLPPLREKWKPIERALAAPRTKNSKNLEDLLALCRETLDKFPTPEQYRALVAKARENPCWLAELLKANALRWDSSREPGGAFVWIAPPEGKASPFVPPDVLGQIVGLLPATAAAEKTLAQQCAGASPNGDVKAALARKAQKDLAANANARAKALAVDKTDGLPSPPASAPTAPPPTTAAAAPIGLAIPGLPAMIGRQVLKLMSDQKELFAKSRGEKTEKLASDALALLRRANGDASVAESLERALRDKDAETRGKNLRALLADADRQFERILGLKVSARLAALRKGSCQKAHQGRARAFAQCLATPPARKEFDAARDAVFTDDPDLGLYFVGRSEYQAFMNVSLAQGLLPKGSQLEPWEVGSSALPEGSTVEVDGEPPDGADKNDHEYLGLRFTKPDHSSLFQGDRQTADGVERLVLAVESDHSRVRSTAVFKPGKNGDQPLRSETAIFDGDGRLVHSEKQAGGVKELKDFNVDGKYAGEPRRIQTEVVKGGKTKTTIVDADAGINTAVGFDDAFTVETRVKGGKPLDPRAKDAKPEERWTAQKGHVRNGKFYMEERDLANGTIVKGSTDDRGKFSITSIQTADGTTMRGKTDERGNFDPWLVTAKDGSGKRQIGRVTAILGPGGKLIRLIADLSPRKSFDQSNPMKGVQTQFDTRESMLKVAEEFVSQAGLAARDAGPLGEWLWDQSRGTDFADGHWGREKGSKKFEETGGVNGAWLVSENPKRQVVYLKTARVGEIENNAYTGKETDEAVAQNAAKWGPGTPFKGVDPGTVLKALDENGVPSMEYVRLDLLRKWLRGYSSTGSNGLITSDAKEYQHSFLMNFKRDPSRFGRWTAMCGDEPDPAVIDPAKKCDEAAEISKAVISEGSSGLSDLGGTLGDLPGLRHLAKGTHIAFNYAASNIQEDFGFQTSDNPNKRMGELANGLRGHKYGKQEALDILSEDRELSEGVDEKAVEKRMKDHPDECTREGPGCRAWAESLGCRANQKPPCVTDDERLGIIDYSFSSAHALAEGGAGVKLLGMTAGLGEQALGAIPLMGTGAGFNALTKWKALGGFASVFGAANAGLGVYMTTSWVVGGVANGGRLYEGIKSHDSGKIWESAGQMAMDGVFAGAMVKEMRVNAKKAEAVRDLALKERDRLLALKSKEVPPPLPDPGTVLLDVRGVDPKAYGAALKAAGVEIPGAKDGFAAIKVEPGKVKALLEKLGGTGAEPIDSAEWAKRKGEKPPERPPSGDEAGGVREKLKDNLAEAQRQAALEPNDPAKLAAVEKARQAYSQGALALDTDLMTGTKNRGSLEKNAPAAIDGLRAAGGRPVVAIGDLNGFGPTNDGLAAVEGSGSRGAALGDKALGKAGRRLNALAAQFDVEIGRYGGEEFVVVGDQPNVMKFLEAAKSEFADRQLFKDAGFSKDHVAAIEKAAADRGRSGQPLGDFTFGVAEVPKDASFKDAVKKADEGLLWAKKNGKRGETMINRGDGTFTAAEPAMNLKERIATSLGKAIRDFNIPGEKTPSVPERIEALRQAMDPADFNEFMKVAFRDPLTGLRTRDYLSARGSEWGPKYSDGGKAAMVSPRGLKPINDAMGHSAGDRFLERYGQIVAEVAAEKKNIGGAIEDPVRLAGKDVVLIGEASPEVAAEAQKRFAKEIQDGKIFGKEDFAKLDRWAKEEIGRRTESWEKEHPGEKPSQSQADRIRKDVDGEVSAVKNGSMLVVEGGIATDKGLADIDGTVDALNGKLDESKRKAQEEVGSGGHGGAPPDSRFLTRQEALERLGGVDPVETKGIPIGGAGGGGAREIEIGGEKWVVKSRRAVDKSTREAYREKGENEMLGRQLVRRFFPEFETSEGFSYQDGDRFVTVNRFIDGRAPSFKPWEALTARQRASLSVLVQVFGFGDVNFGNILFGGDKPALIDFESIQRDKTVDSSNIAAGMIRHGWASFVDRGAYNDPALYSEEYTRWKERFADPKFQRGLDAALDEAGIKGSAAQAYKKTLQTNLKNYEANMKHYLDIVNAANPKPKAALEPVVAR